MTVQELAAKTAAEIRRRGWSQGAMADLNGWWADDGYTLVDGAYNECKVCLVGGIAAAVAGSPKYGWDVVEKPGMFPEMIAFLDEIVTRTGVKRYDSVVDWNDNNERTVDEVLALLDSIAAEQVVA